MRDILSLKDPPNDEPDVEIIELSNNKIFIKKNDPFGFWSANWEAGRLPEHLTGMFTSKTLLKQKVMEYLRDKDRVREIRADEIRQKSIQKLEKKHQQFQRARETFDD